MGDPRKRRIYFAQLGAMLRRNLLLKKRDKRRTMAEVLLPIYTLGVLFLIKVAVPNPNFPEINQPRGGAELLANFRNISHTVAVVPNSTDVQDFLKTVDVLWDDINKDQNTKVPPIAWVVYPTTEDLLTAYWMEPNDIPLAVIFHSPDPINGPLSYTIRTNPNLFGTPSTIQLYGSQTSCREYNSFWQSVPGVPTPVLPEGLEVGDSCPVNQYYYSGFLALQALMDFTKIRLDAGIENLAVPKIVLEMFPKPFFTGNWMVIVRVVIPLYTVIALSQFITYLLILIVGEKEKKIKEGMKIMGLYDSVFWLSWFIIYAAFVLLLTIICCSLLFALNIFTNTSFILVFMLIFMYCLSIIMFGFMLTPFFDKSRTAGILGNFAVTILSLLYFIQVFVKESSSVALWIVSLISPAGFALAMDKAFIMDLAGEGVNISNIWSGPGMPFGGSLIMMAVNIVLYGWIAYYLDSVIPSEYGVKRSPFFCFNPRFWCKSKPADKIPLTNGESIGSVGSLNTGDEGLTDFEPVPREMKGKEAIKIVDLYKSFKQFRKPEVKAINGINLTIYQGHITAILGHNGAGKTTLFNILTGLTAPTSGTAYIFGYDVRNQNEMDQVRRMTGVCPQHDILFDNLTPKEHLEFFATVKGIPSSKIEAEVTRTLQDVDLTDKINTPAVHLSGGQKRKLSVGIAVIGDPKIIILDEPTAGVDPYSRRHMWNVLQNRRHGKVILLTTHFMDEADILADRKAVVSKGSIRCCGSSLFLKNKFGIGYHLTLVLEGNSKEQAIARLVTTHVSKAEKARRHGRELSFILPHNAVDHFATLFSAIEAEINNKNSKLGISSYGVSMTTLEEVFLHLEKAEDEPDEAVDNLSKKIVRNRALSRSLSLQSKSTSYQSLQNEGNNLMVNGQETKAGSDLQEIGGLEAISETKSPISGIGLEKIECTPNVCQTLLALIKLRALRMCRDLQKLYFMILLPLVCAALSLYFTSYFESSHVTAMPLELNSTTYGDMSTMTLFNDSSSDISSFIYQLSQLGVRTDMYNGNFSSLLKIAPHLGGFDVHSFEEWDYRFTVLYNDTYLHSMPITLNILSNTIYRLLTPDKANFEPIKVMAQPFQQTMQPEGVNIASTTQTVFVGMVFVMVPVSLAVDLVYDRELKTKNQLRVNGLSTVMYFMTYFIVLIALMTIKCIALIIMMILFDVPALRAWPAIVVFSVLIFIYCPSSILSCTCISYIFDKTDSAQSILPNIATFIGWIPFVFVVLLDVINTGKTIALAVHMLFSVTNTMYIPYSIVYNIQRVYMLCNVNSACDTLTLASYFTPEIGILLFGMLLNIPFWFVLLKIVDIKKSGGRARDAFKFLAKANYEESHIEADAADVGENEDQDVKAEREKVKNLTRSPNVTPPVVMVQDLHKVYKNKHSKSNSCSSCCFKPDENEEKTKVAVKSLSIAVDAGEVFGLLGHNGAGKTTTMKIITAEEAPTRGRVFIGGQSITSNLNSAFQLLGYCPQHDALWRNITVREHLETYAAIRGVPSRDINKIVNRYINGLQIQDHADKQVKMCSGGTKRKLSFAMSMVGNPKIVLLDEPSTGMDPRSKRFLWDTILASFQGAKGAILTTHSMEEADALCSRVGITVKGELRCLGSTQHLKNLYGAGYTLEIKLKVGDTTPTSDSGDRHQDLKDFVAGLFPDANLEEAFVDRLVFSVPQQSVPSLANCFMQLEKARLELDIEEYSFSQTTLEQVFLKFAQYDEINGD